MMIGCDLDPRIVRDENYLVMDFSPRFCSNFSFPQDMTCSQRDVKGLLHHEEDTGDS